MISHIILYIIHSSPIPKYRDGHINNDADDDVTNESYVISMSMNYPFDGCPNCVFRKMPLGQLESVKSHNSHFRASYSLPLFLNRRAACFLYFTLHKYSNLLLGRQTSTRDVKNHLEMNLSHFESLKV